MSMKVEEAVRDRVETGRTETAPRKETDFVPLEEVVDAIRRDARTDADGYLDEARVPFGGE